MLTFFRSFKKSELTLLVASSFLIAIWPMRDTIAARNILLVVCTLISIFYLYKNFRLLVWSQKQSIKNWMPIILLALLFIWVLIHYLFFSYDPVAQLKELTSTWARSLMASIIGFTVGLIINKRNKGCDYIFIALIVGFVILFFQYAIRIFNGGEIYQEMWWSSIYWGKINQVLYGILFIAGTLAIFDASLLYKSSSRKIINYSRLYFYLLGVSLILHCYVFQIKSMNGLGISCILLLIFFAKNWKKIIQWSRLSNGSITGKNIATIFLLLTIVFFTFFQVKNDSRWRTLIGDIKIAALVDEYPNWQTAPSTPIFTNSGRKVSVNVYERGAWAIIATRLVKHHPLGYGLVHNSFRYLAQFEYPNSDLTLSHSGWLDLGLSFGVPGVGLGLTSLIWTLYLSIRSKANNATLVLWLCLGIFFVYALAEIFYYHGAELLVFWLVFLPAIIMPISVEIRESFGKN